MVEDSTAQQRQDGDEALEVPPTRLDSHGFAECEFCDLNHVLAGKEAYTCRALPGNMLDASTPIQRTTCTQWKRNVAESAKRKHNPAESSASFSGL
jgi:hypothetical protein